MGETAVVLAGLHFEILIQTSKKSRTTSVKRPFSTLSEMASSLNTTPSGSKGATPSSSSLNRLSTASNEGKSEGSKLRNANPSQYVKLNVGGYLHYTTIGTLTKHDNMLRAVFSGRMEVLSDSEGWILIDRSGKHFGTILNFLRDGDVTPLPESRREILELQAEAKYYCIEELVEHTDKAVKNMKRDTMLEVEPRCRVPLITSLKEEQALIQANASKPLIKLLINRHNNKYSYTGASDENLLKNIELFDKLSLRFSNRVLFIKDVIGSNEICCWSFYGHGKRIAEVCCTAIVYATDRKNTKVEFPEARIYEETLNCLLYENRNGPDQELMQATSLRVPVASYTSDDEDERNRLVGEGGLGPGGGGGGGSGGGVPRSHSSGLARLRSNKNS